MNTLQSMHSEHGSNLALGVWVNEQAAREIYLKAFQAPVEKGKRTVS